MDNFTKLHCFFSLDIRETEFHNLKLFNSLHAWWITFQLRFAILYIKK